jgi:hypothetical protein
MASLNERFTVAGKWYDPDNNPGELHDDLRRNYAMTYQYATTRPSVRRHIEACQICQSIGAATAAAPSPLGGRKRLKLEISQAQMHQLLRLPENFEIVHMFADNDPNEVSVLIAGEGLPETDELTETPRAQLDDVADDTPPTAS